MQKTLTKTLILAIVLTAALGVNYLFAAWTGPTQNPPAGNTETPVHIGTTDQVKDGGLSLDGLSVFGGGYFQGSVGVGVVTPTEKLDVSGNIRASGTVCGSNGCVGGGIPSGIIAMWSGTLMTIPSSWALCDGTNGTPDLRDKFIYGTSVSENPGATGGSSTYSLTVAQMPAHTHSGSTNIAGNHSHGGGIVGGCCGYGGYGWSHLGSTGGGGSHSHSLSINSTGSGALIDNRPSYYKLAFICKI